MGTNTQTAEPRVLVTGHRVAPCPELPFGFYAAKISAAGPKMATTVGGSDIAITGLSTLVVDAAKLPALIADLQAAQIELAAQAMADKAGVVHSIGEDDALLAELDSEEPITLSAPEFSGTITGAIGRSGNYRHIWEVLDDRDSPTWAQLTDSELRAITADYRHSLTDQGARDLVEAALSSETTPRLVMMMAAKAVFVGRAAEVLAYEPTRAAAYQQQQDPAAGGDA